MNHLTTVATASFALIASASIAAELPSFHIGAATYTFDPEKLLITAHLDGDDVPLLRGFGPGWEADGASHAPLGGEVEVIHAAGSGKARTYTYSSSPGDLRWQATLRPGPYNDLTIELTSDDARVSSARPGSVVAGGDWIGLNLSQYQLAHGQTDWPKTFYLRDHDLYLCAWWELEASNASQPDWPPEQCEPATGTGPFAPAAAMRYVAGPDGQHAPLHDTLHIRVARRLWDAALPSLCRPSEYRREMAGMVYLEFWDAEPAAHMRHVLDRLGRLIVPYGGRPLAVVQNWEAGGWDALLPDSIWLPDYPPNPAVGTVEDLGRVAELGDRLGRFGFRTNYMVLRRQSPSFQRGLVGFALGPDGRPTWHTQPARWAALAGRQEKEVARLWRPNAAGFTDQLASGGGPWAWLDFDRACGGDGTIATALRHQRQLARLIKEAHHGPLGSETLNQQDLIGYYCDFGDFGIMDGHDRLFAPDYKLRRLQEVTVSYGCGLLYRFFELPPFPRMHSGQLDVWRDPSWMDDYRCCEVMLGNGAYVWWRSPWSWVLTECVLIGRLQQQYALQPVESVEYLAERKWQTLEGLVRPGFVPQTRPWNQQQPEFGRVRVQYRNGLILYVNRLPDELTVQTPHGERILPQYGWVASKPDGSVLAYSAYWPGTHHRVDYLEERGSGLRFLNPRGRSIEGSTRLRLWERGRLVWSVDPEAEVAYVAGETLPLNPPAPPALTDMAFDFRKGLEGWRPIHGVLRVANGDDGVRLTIVDPDPQLYSPPLAVPGRAGDVLELTMSANAGEIGQLYFATQEDGISARQFAQFRVVPDGKPHIIEVPVGRDDLWAGHEITQVRLDPIHGPDEAEVVLTSLRLRRE